MKAMKKLVGDGEYPDLTEAIRAAVNLLIEVHKYPSLWHWHRAHEKAKALLDPEADGITESTSPKPAAPGMSS
ncbi:hypothetical protein [Methanoregula sp.]|uniref:hypothetical protein n=1 Tax=Methanoregula sp. TaxID=2052170 RepID=UPI003563B1F7